MSFATTSIILSSLFYLLYYLGVFKSLDCFVGRLRVRLAMTGVGRDFAVVLYVLSVRGLGVGLEWAVRPRLIIVKAL